jgi:type VI secretion system protein ImpL
MASLKQDLERLYLDDFLNKWRAYLAELKPRPVSSLADNVQRLRDGGGPLSPIAPLLRAIAQATDLSQSKVAQQAVTGLAARAGRLSQLGEAAGVGNGGGADPKATVIAEFLPLRLYVGMPAGGGPAPAGAPAQVDALMAAMTQLADKLNVIAVLPGGGGATGSAASLEARALVAQLDQLANSAPSPAGMVAKAVASDASVALGGQRLAQMGSAVNESFGEACNTGVMHSFPVQPASVADLPVATLNRFFAPNGSFASFVGKELVGYIDTTTPDWQATPNASEIGLTEADVRALHAANVVTRSFYAVDPQSPHLTYQIEPIALTGAHSVVLKIDGQALNYDGKSTVPATFDWPSGGEATIEFTVDGSAPASRSWPGPWAAFRMMRAAAIRAAGSPAIGTGSLTQGGARFDFRVRTPGVANPFVVDPFIKIACPQISKLPGSAKPVSG